MAYTYILRCSDGSFYVGSTRSLRQRLEQHAGGAGSEYTKHRLPVALVWAQEFDRIDEAYAWERRIHGWGHRKREAFIAGGFDAIAGWSVRERQRAAEGKERGEG